MNSKERKLRQGGLVLLEYILLISFITFTSITAFSYLSDSISEKIKEVSNFLKNPEKGKNNDILGGSR